MLSSSRISKRNTAMALAIGASLMAILLIGAVAGSTQTTAGTPYDNVQVFVHTSNSTFAGTYTITAYNSTGYVLVTSTTPYAAASFELPGASYIFTVSADSNYQYVCPLAASGSATSGGAPGSTSNIVGTVSGGTAEILPPCYSGYPESEYGFVSQQVTGPTTINISTQPMSELPTTTITVHVSYVNGTAAAGTSVYASVLGGTYQYSGCDVCALTSGATGPAPLNMSGTVGSDGTATMTVPAVPVDVTAWNWIPVNLPVSQNTTTVTVGGEKVSVTVTWEPSYIGLAGSVLIVPPQTSGSITLHVQQPTYWASPGLVNGVASGALATGAAVSSSPSSVPASVASQQNLGQSGTQNAVQTSTAVSTVVEQVQTTVESSPAASSGTSYVTVLATIVAALALAVASASVIMVRRKSDL